MGGIGPRPRRPRWRFGLVPASALSGTVMLTPHRTNRARPHRSGGLTPRRSERLVESGGLENGLAM